MSETTTVDMGQARKLEKLCVKFAEKTIERREGRMAELRLLKEFLAHSSKYTQDKDNVVIEAAILDVKRAIDNDEKAINLYDKQLACKHATINRDVWVGNGHNHDFYETQCKHCNAVLDEYRV